MATGTSLQRGSRGRPGCPHQDGCSLSRAAAFPFPFTSGYDVSAAWLVFRRGLHSGNPGWQMFSFVSDRRVAAMVWPCWQFYWLLYHFHPCSPCPQTWRGDLPSSFRSTQYQNSSRYLYVLLMTYMDISNFSE